MLMSSDPLDEKARKSRNRQWLNQLATGEKKALNSARLFGGLLTLTIIGQMALIAWLVDQLVVAKQSLTTLSSGFIALLALMLLRALLQGLQEQAGNRAGNRLRLNVRRQLLAKTAELGPVHLSGDSPAALSSQWLEQVDSLQAHFARFVPQMTLSWLSPLLILVLVLYLDWLAAIFLLISAPLIPLFMALVGWGAERLNQQHFVLLKRLSGNFLDRIRGLSTLQLFGQTDNACNEVVSATEGYRRLNMKTLRVAFLSSAVLEFFASVAIAAVAIYIGFGLLGYIDWGPAEELTLFSGLLILLLAPEFFQPLRTLAQQYHDRAAALGAADSLVDLLQRQPSQTQAHPQQTQHQTQHQTAPESAAEASSSEALIELHQVCLSYPGRGQVLGPVSLSLPASATPQAPGQALVITGRTGSGKSSLLHLLAGFIQPTQGQICIRGAKPGTEPLIWMQQQAFIFQGSWAENLQLAAPDASQEQMQQAIQQVGLATLLAQQPQGLDSPLLEGGKNLSGGQAQRLALARALLSPSRLLLLDEPSASLDQDATAELIALLHTLRQQGCSLIIASHDPAFLTLADQHLVLPDATVYSSDNPQGDCHAPA